MTPEQAVTSSSRSGTRLSEQGVNSACYLIRTFLWFLAFFLISLAMRLGTKEIASAIEKLKPTITLHEHPTKIEVIQPKPLLPEVRQ